MHADDGLVDERHVVEEVFDERTELYQRGMRPTVSGILTVFAPAAMTSTLLRPEARVPMPGRVFGENSRVLCNN